MRRVKVGQVLKAQGIKGELKIRLLTYDVEQFCGFDNVIIGDRSFCVGVVYQRPNGVFVRLEDINDRDEANALANQFIYADVDEDSLDQDEYFKEDLIGCEVYAGNDLVGKIKSINNYGSADVIELDSKPICRFPFLKILIVSVDLENKKITLDQTKFNEVACYED